MYLVTGGSGYFGEIMVKKLLLEKKKVRIFDINRPKKEISDLTDVIIGDITDKAAVHRACQGIKLVFHNIAQVPLARDKKKFYNVNFHGTHNLLESMKNNKVKKLVYTSSSAIFGIPKYNPVVETTKPSPMEAYGKAKYEAELLCKDYIKLGLDISIVRPRTIVGHGRLGIFSILFDWLRKGYNLPVLDNGNNIYQFIHAEDLAEICLRVSNKKGFDVYNAGASKFYTMRETLEGLCKHANTGSRVKSLPMGLIENGINILSLLRLSPLGKYHSLMYGRSLYFDNIKVQKQLKYKTKYDSIEALCSSYDSYLQNLEINKMITNQSHHKSFVKQKLLYFVRYFL